MLSIAAISSVVCAGKTYNGLWDLSNSDAVTNNIEVLNSGYSPFITDLDNIYRIIFYLLLSVIMSFISIFSVRCFTNCKRV